MGQASTIGLDIAKRVFQAHGADALAFVGGTIHLKLGNQALGSDHQQPSSASAPGRCRSTGLQDQDIGAVAATRAARRFKAVALLAVDPLSCGALVSSLPMAAWARRNLAAVILNGAPPLRPRARAAAMPAFVRSTIKARSNPGQRREDAEYQLAGDRGDVGRRTLAVRSARTRRGGVQNPAPCLGCRFYGARASRSPC